MDNETKRKLCQSRKTRGSLKARVTFFENFVSKLITSITEQGQIEPTQLLDLKNRTTKFETLFNDFEAVQLEIELLTDETENEYKERDSFDNSFHSILSKAQNIIYDSEANNVQIIETRSNLSGANSGSISLHSNTSPVSVRRTSVRLPPINLPVFDGNYEQWLRFHDYYDSLIHKNVDLTDIQRFHYLKGSLQGEAAEIISNIEMSANNYPNAWDLIKKRFENRPLLIHNHIKSLFSIEKVINEEHVPIRNLVNNVTRHLRALEALEQPISHWDCLIIFLVSSKLDPITAREWEVKKKESNELLTLNKFMDFLTSKADVLESLQLSHTFSAKSADKQSSKIRPGSFVTTNNNCNFCEASHKIYQCKEFLQLSIPDRIRQIKVKKLCSNCLGQNHFAKDCKSSQCRICHSRHNTLLHIVQPQVAVQSEVPQPQVNSNAITLTSYNANEQVLLCTATVKVVDKNGTSHLCRILLDSASQSNFITQDLCNRLMLDKSYNDMSIVGINQVKSKLKYKCALDLHSCVNNKSFSLTCLVIPNICDNLPTCLVDKSLLNIPPTIKLADPSFFKPNKIDILLGASHFWTIIQNGKISLGNGLPCLQESLLGWLVTGPIPNSNQNQTYCHFIQNAEHTALNEQLRKFWEVEERYLEPVRSEEEQNTELDFCFNTKRDNCGRFIVKIPFKTPPEKLGSSKERAFKQFMSLERKLLNNDTMRSMYTEFLKEYQELGHMTLVSDDESLTYYMPHHGVLKASSTTTKLRVVFNASAPSDSGFSLNDLQMIGPTIQSDLFSILIRFRQHRYVVTSDVEKMYRQVLIDPSQRPLQRILWRENPQDPVQIFQLNTVTYGTTSGSFLAIRCLEQLSIENKKTHPDASNAISKDFYVDDLLTGGNSIPETIQLCKDIEQILSQGCFRLRKWRSSEPCIENNFSINDNTDTIFRIPVDQTTSTLGFLWSRDDNLVYSIRLDRLPNVLSKRYILSCISRIFDPLGLLSPVIITGKILMQRLWLEGISWDDQVPISIEKLWTDFYDNLLNLNLLKIPRLVFIIHYTKVELHAFADASSEAYGSCLYFKTSNSQNESVVNLICSKSKVAPLKTISIPRLELCAALLASQLVDKIIECSGYSIQNVHFWTDSSVVLGWIRTPPNQLKTYVGNRVAEIQSLSKFGVWHHVRSKHNPADIVSRGIKSTDLIRNSTWWHGPQWLTLPESDWPLSEFDKIEKLPELKSNNITLVNVIAYSDIIDFNRFSNYNRIIRTYAYVNRFIHNCRFNKLRKIGLLSVNEMQQAEIDILKIVQHDTFNKDIDDLKTKGTVHPKSKLLSFNPFIDSNGLLRVGGRLSNSEFPYDKKHPIMLPSLHHLTTLIFRNEHCRLLHAGPQHLLASVRERFWPLRGRDIARRVIHECYACYKTSPKFSNPIMANLPKERIELVYPFHTTGTDYCGPFSIKDRKGRGCKISKGYVCLFKCFSTKAVHIELVSDLTKDSFIAALRRFVARRGRPAKIYSDNGTNFIGANNELIELTHLLQSFENDIASELALDGIQWQFIPPHSPHMGGLWESGIKAIKYHLRRVIGKAIFTYELLYTFLTQIESVINSRPLYPLSNNPNDLDVLTPSHFLIGRASTSIIDPDLRHLPVSRLSTYQHVQLMRQHFWDRWHKDYLCELHQRRKWALPSKSNIQEGVLVLLKEDNQPPIYWPLGRIVSTHPGRDGVVRIVTIKTLKGLVKRAVAKVSPLPQFENNDSFEF